MKITLLVRYNMAKAGRKRSYESYKNQYRAKQRQLESNGVTMNQRMLTESEFNSQYNRTLAKREFEVSKGKRKTTGNITRDIVSRQAYSLTTKQAEALLKVHPEISYYEARSGLVIDEVYNLKKNEYLLQNPEEYVKANQIAAVYVSTEFFGS